MSRIQVSIDELGYAIDNGFTDTICLLVDLYKLAGKRRQYDYMDIPSQLGMIQKKVLRRTFEVLNLKDKILANGFDRRDRIRTKKIKGKEVEEKQTSWINNDCEGYAIYYNVRTYYFSIMCQHSTILGKAEKEIMRDIKNLFKDKFGVEDKYIQNFDKATVLGRIDFKRDHRYKGEQHLYLIKFLVDIAPETIVNKNYKKLDEKDEHLDIDNFDDIEYMKKFKSESNTTAEFVIYDKFLERLDKFDRGLISSFELEDYERIIRFECRIKNDKLENLKKKADWGLDKKIDNYKEENVADELFDYYAQQIFFQAPFFYRIDVAKRILRNVDDEILTPYKKKECRTVLNAIHKKGYTRAKEEYHYPSAFSDRIKDIQALGISPLTFPATWTDRKGNTHKTTYTKIPNFIKKENCVKEDDYIIDSKYMELLERKRKNTKAL